MKNNYFYKSESEQFAFYRIPKLLFTDSRYAGISVEAKVLYGLMLDRMNLSVRNNWVDDDNRVYIYFTLEEITDYLSIGKDKGVKLLKELDGMLIERKKQGLGKPVMIYVLNFVDNQNSVQSIDNSTEVLTSDVDNSIKNADFGGSNAEVQTSEKPKSGENAEVRTSEKAKSGENAEVLTSEIPKSALRKNRALDFGKSDSNNTNINNTDLNKTDISSSSRISFAALEHEREEYRDVIKTNIEYDILIQQYAAEKIDSFVNIMVDSLCSFDDKINVNSMQVPKEVVKRKLLKLDYMHIVYVIDCLDENSTKIRNYKSYILTMLYNAPDTMNHYYQSKFNKTIMEEKTNGKEKHN